MLFFWEQHFVAVAVPWSKYIRKITYWGVNLLTDYREMQHACFMHFKPDTFDDYLCVRNDHWSFQRVIMSDMYIYLLYYYVLIYIYIYVHAGISGSRSNTFKRVQKTKWKQWKTISWLHPEQVYNYLQVFVRPGSFVCPGSDIGLVTGVDE